MDRVKQLSAILFYVVTARAAAQEAGLCRIEDLLRPSDPNLEWGYSFESKLKDP